MSNKPVEIRRDDQSRQICYVYKAPATPKSEKSPHVVLCGCTCPTPDNENYPFKPEVFEWLAQIKPYILKYAKQYDVPPIAVAGGIADEYNTRFMPKYSLAKRTMDLMQDHVIPYHLPLPIDWLRAKAQDKMMQAAHDFYKKTDPNNEHRSPLQRLEITSGDYGKGNISMLTAMDLYHENIKTFPAEKRSMDNIELLQYIVTDEGTAHFSALAIMHAKKDMWPAIKDLPPRKQEAVLVTYFKQGPAYFKRFLAKNKGLPSNKIQAGEGCRTCYQRKKIGQAMGIDVDSLEPAK